MDTKKEMKLVMDMTAGVFDEDGSWKTINGTHVFIEGGEITKGPAALTGGKSSGKKSSGMAAVNSLGSMSPDELSKAEKRRDALWDKKDHDDITEEESKELNDLQDKIQRHYTEKQKQMQTVQADPKRAAAQKERKAKFEKAAKEASKSRNPKDMTNEEIKAEIIKNTARVEALSKKNRTEAEESEYHTLQARNMDLVSAGEKRSSS